jgi:methyl-accepting chemotaxis protein
MKRLLPFCFILFGTVIITPDALGQEMIAANEVINKDVLIKGEVETAVSMLEALEKKHQQGEMTMEQAKELGAYLLRTLRYGDEGYFWADTEEGINVVLYGRADVEGKNRIDAKDPNGVPYIREFIALGKAGGGYVNYSFPKKGEKEPLPKRSYVMPFRPFGWIVGSGYYRTKTKNR